MTRFFEYTKSGGLPPKPYYQMSFGKWALCAMLGGTLLFCYGVYPGFGILTAKHPLTWPTEVDLSSEPRLGLSPPPVMAVATPHQTKCKTVYLPYQSMTANLGQFETMDAAQRHLAKLKGHLNDCGEDFCKGLADKASIQKGDWPGGTTYFLTIGRIDDPTFYALCDYMWNTEDAWARQPYHRCADFENRDDP